MYIYGDNIDCGERHKYRNRRECVNRETEEVKTCLFIKIMNDALRNGCLGIFNLYDEWMQAGLDIILCSLIQNEGAEISKICGGWTIDNPNKLTKSIAYNACFEMLKMCGEEEQAYLKYNSICCHAALFGFVDVAKLCKKRGAFRFGDAMCYAAEYGHIEIVELCKKWDADDHGFAALAAGANGWIEIVKLYKKWGLENFGEVACRAAENGHIEIAKLCREWGVSEPNRYSILAARNGHFEVVKFCKEWGANNPSDVMYHASEEGYNDIVKFCKMWETEIHKSLR